MAEQADFYVKNRLKTHGGIYVSRKLGDGTSDLNITVAYGEESERIYLGGTDVSLIITLHEGADAKEHPFNVKSDTDLAASHSRTDSRWTIQIAPNNLPPDVPTTVNIAVGEPET